jgi:hypothetical protein
VGVRCCEALDASATQRSRRLSCLRRLSCTTQLQSAGVVIDFDRDGNVIGIDIDHASRLDLGEVALVRLPLISGNTS